MALIDRFNAGGFFMYFILAVGVASLFLLVDRFVMLYVRTRPVQPGFRAQLRTFLKNGDLAGAREFAATSPRAALGPIVDLACSLRLSGAGDDELQARMDEALSELVHKIDRRTSFLAVVGNVATLIGLLGTISGMIRSFSAVGGASATERASLLSLGISEAMNCTAFGLLVAIPALLAYALFQNKTEVVVNNLTSAVSKLYHDLIYTYEPRTGLGRTATAAELKA